MLKTLVSHPTSNQNNRAILNGLYRANMLYMFYTTIAAFPKDFLFRLSKFSSFSEVSRRSFDPELKGLTTTTPFLEFGRLISARMGFERLIKHEVGIFSIDSVYQNLDKRVANSLCKHSEQGLEAIYAYEDCAHQSFYEAKKLGLKCFYDLPIAYWETGKLLLLEEAERFPDWAITFSAGIKDSEEKLEHKTKELELADVVVLPSKFVRDSLPVWASNKKVIMSPFGSPQSNFEGKPLKKDDSLKPLRVLFVGSMSQRKGLADLFQAIKMINSSLVELVVLGSLQAPLEFYKDNLNNFTYERGRPHQEVLKLMRTCDIFCLPSLVEGRALVMQEAMSQGLPLIITPNTGGEDLVIEGETGFLVPVRSPECIAEKIIWFLENRDRIPIMSKSAQQHAMNYTWEKYTDTIINQLKQL